jgi:membrane-bound metal-dependent hydrolase YbcI (DUF457 family)
MNKYNHFLTSFIVLFILFNNQVSIIEIVLFAAIFGVLIDQNQRIGKYLKKPREHTRTWIEEPFGLILIGIPLGLILSMIKKDYFFMVIVPYGLHIIQDYITIHEVSPFAPFSNKNIKLGFFKSVPPASWYTGKEKGISENYVLILNVIITLSILWMHNL